MLTLPAAGLRIQRELLQLEDTVNDALAQAAALTQSCALARKLPEVSASTGQATLLRLASLTQHLTQGSGDIARIHGDLRTLNIEIKAMPDADGVCPPPSAVTPISVVA